LVGVFSEEDMCEKGAWKGGHQSDVHRLEKGNYVYMWKRDLCIYEKETQKGKVSNRPTSI